MAELEVQNDDSHAVIKETFWDTEMTPKEEPNNERKELPVRGISPWLTDVSFGISKHTNAATTAARLALDASKNMYNRLVYNATSGGGKKRPLQPINEVLSYTDIGKLKALQNVVITKIESYKTDLQNINTNYQENADIPPNIAQEKQILTSNLNERQLYLYQLIFRNIK